MATEAKTENRLETTKTRLRRGRQAYIGLYGLAYDRIQMRRAQARELTESLFEELTEKGETTYKQAEILLKHAQKGAWKNYADVTDKVTEFVPFKIKSRVEVLQEELETLQATYERLAKSAVTTAKKTTSKKTKSKKTATKTTASQQTSTETVKKVVEKAVEVAAKPAPFVEAKPVVEKKAVVATPKAEQPRHIPYYLDVRRYDPLANEDVVRKIVNHCGIALRSEDARHVACSDEAERITVRESWLKRKLGMTAVDTDLDKKVLQVCDLMQRDQKKNRVTFYYLLAKKERLLDTL